MKQFKMNHGSLLQCPTMKMSYKYTPLQPRLQCRCCCYCMWITYIVFILLTITLLCFCPWLFMQCSVDFHTVPPRIHDFSPNTISFSSCMNNWGEHLLMDNINAPVHVFLGDSIYGDDYRYTFLDSKPNSALTLPEHMIWYYRLMYNKLSCRYTFQKMAQRTSYMLSIWDDHDYGSDDELEQNRIKAVTKAMFVKFWRLHESRHTVTGVYGSYEFDNVLIILPDLHFSSNNMCVFSEEQWAWLQTMAVTAHTKLTVVGMSTPITSLIQKYPIEITKFLALFNHTTTVFVAGDPHSPSIHYLPQNHIEVVSSPLDQNLHADSPLIVCNTTCATKQPQNNFAVLDLVAKTATVYGENGPILYTRIFV